MKQLFQNLKTGQVTLNEIPAPIVEPGQVLVRTTHSLLSPGTERMLSDFGKASWIGKARQQPDKVRQVIQKLATDGLETTVRAVFSKLDQPLPLGYCNVGEIVEVGSGVHGLAVGDRVISNGPHAEYVVVPDQLVAKIPAEVPSDAASFSVLSAIALQGIRLIAPQLGESVVVQGLGLIGLLACQILKANGCRVLGFDLDANKVTQARSFGVTAVTVTGEMDPVSIAMDFSAGHGVDAVLITASTKSNEPIHQAPQMCRIRGRVVLVGVVGLELSRADFYEKEISFQVSCSYGPGRYDPAYEQRGLDYPIGFVRWTEQRNFTAVLDLMAAGSLDPIPLVSKRLQFTSLESQYDSLISDPSSLGVVVEYPSGPAKVDRLIWQRATAPNLKSTPIGKASVGVIGAGNFAANVLVPALKSTGAELFGIASATGSKATHLAKKFGLTLATSDARKLISRPEVNTVVIATRHDTHASLTIEAIGAGKNVFVEKPLALSIEELKAVAASHQRHPKPLILVGFNRRFSPLTTKVVELLGDRTAPLAMQMTVNAGPIPADNWVHDPIKGGGRILGEACHFIDLLSFIAKAPVERVFAASVGHSIDNIVEDKMTIQLMLADGSIGTIHYFANGSKDLPKERLEIFCDGKVLQLNNFLELTGYGFKRFRKLKLRKQDKGHQMEIASFIEAVTDGKPSPIRFDELYESTLATLAAKHSAEVGKVVAVSQLDNILTRDTESRAQASVHGV